MKKRLLIACLLALLLCGLCVSALADGFVDDASEIRSQNLLLTPMNGNSFMEGYIPWYASASLSPTGSKEWVSYYTPDVGRFDRVRVVVYKASYSYYTGTRYNLYRILASQDYNDLRDINFSNGGTVYLPAGTYKICMETLWDGNTGDNYTTIRAHNFTVNRYPQPTATPKPTPIPTPVPTPIPVPQHATVTLTHRLHGTGQLLYQVNVTCQTGYQTLYPYWSHPDYELVNTAGVQMYIAPGHHYYVNFDYVKKVYVAPATPVPVVTMPPTPVPTPRPVTLKLGSTGENVRTVQRRLKELNFYIGSVDGYFGMETDDAVRRFQQQYGLVADGKVGVLTLEALYTAYATAKPAYRPVTPAPIPTPLPTAVPTPRPTPLPTAVPTPRPTFYPVTPQVTPLPGEEYDPENPFLYGIEEYEYCLAPEYCVDPSDEPWNFCYLYTKPSDINGINLGIHYKGEVLKVIKYYGGNHGRFNYCYVITQDNEMGYVHDYALKPIEESQAYYEKYILNAW